jgi:hypothetical protein
MQRKELNFTIQEAGCLLYAADKNLGGFPWRELTDFFGGRKGLRDLTLNGAIMATELYQDDGYYVRVVFGDLNTEEKAEWTARVRWKLNLESGEMAVSGVCDEDMEDYMEDFPVAADGGDYNLGCFVQVPPGEYAVSIYSYPPGDLSGGWMRIEDSRMFNLCFGKDSDIEHEKPIDYFNRTRPNETPPAWIKDEYENTVFLNFLIHVAPLSGEPKTPEFEPDGCLAWEYRKPEICPVGIGF